MSGRDGAARAARLLGKAILLELALVAVHALLARAIERRSLAAVMTGVAWSWQGALGALLLAVRLGVFVGVPSAVAFRATRAVVAWSVRAAQRSEPVSSPRARAAAPSVRGR